MLARRQALGARLGAQARALGVLALGRWAGRWALGVARRARRRHGRWGAGRHGRGRAGRWSARERGSRRGERAWARGRAQARGRARGRQARGACAAGARQARGMGAGRAAWAPGLALGSALGALSPFSIRFDSFFFFLSHQMNTVHCKIKFFQKKKKNNIYYIQIKSNKF